MMRRHLSLCFLSVLLTLVSACGRKPPPEILPPARRAELYLARHEERCQGIRDFEARGTLRASRGWWAVQARERIIFLAPDRLRINVRNPGFLGLGAVEADLLCRGESLYVSIEGEGLVWAGTGEEMERELPTQGSLLLAFLEEVKPGGPLGCDRGGGRWQGSEEEMLLSSSAGLLRRLVALDPHERFPVESLIYGEGDTLLARASYADHEETDGFWRPFTLEWEFPGEGVTVILEHEEQSINQGLEADLFAPPTERGFSGGPERGKMAEDRARRDSLAHPGGSGRRTGVGGPGGKKDGS